jgi:ABC-type uncharacterized transport system permease subunit
MAAFAGVNPFELYYLMYVGSFGSWFSIQNTLTRAAPLILAALCTALPARLGLVIIGGEGALILGGLASVCVGLALGGAPYFVVIGAMATAGMLAGGLLIAAVGLLRNYRGVNETIASLLMFYIVQSVFSFLVEGGTISWGWAFGAAFLLVGGVLLFTLFGGAPFLWLLKRQGMTGKGIAALVSASGASAPEKHGNGQVSSGSNSMPRLMLAVCFLVAGVLCFVFGWSWLAPSLRDPASLNKPSTYPIQADYMLGKMFGWDVHWGLAFGVIFCIFSYILMMHTTFGFAARMVGGNMRAAQASGLPVGRLIFVTCFLAGAAAGLAGMVEVAAVHRQANASLIAGYGFTGILVAFIARQHPLGVIPAGILFGGLGAASGMIQRRLKLPDASIEVFKGVIFVLILFFETFYGRFKLFQPRPEATQAAEEPRPAPAPAAHSVKTEAASS